MPFNQAHNIHNITENAKKIRTRTTSDVLGTDFHFSGENTNIQLYLEAYYQEILQNSYEHDKAVVIDALSKYNLALSEKTKINNNLDAIQMQIIEVKLKQTQLRENLAIKKTEFEDIRQYHKMTKAAAQNSNEFDQAHKESAINLEVKEAEVLIIEEQLANLCELLKKLELESKDLILLLEQNKDSITQEEGNYHTQVKQFSSQTNTIEKMAYQSFMKAYADNSRAKYLAATAAFILLLAAMSGALSLLCFFAPYAAAITAVVMVVSLISVAAVFLAWVANIDGSGGYVLGVGIGLDVLAVGEIPLGVMAAATTIGMVTGVLGVIMALIGAGLAIGSAMTFQTEEQFVDAIQHEVQESRDAPNCNRHSFFSTSVPVSTQENLLANGEKSGFEAEAFSLI